MVMTDWLKAILLTVLRGYHGILSPCLPPSCRFYPSCSIYAAQAIQRHGVQKGIRFGLLRLLRCHPWNSGGYDPVQ